MKTKTDAEKCLDSAENSINLAIHHLSILYEMKGADEYTDEYNKEKIDMALF